MGGRAVECTGLENRQSRKRLVGSNPTPSASQVCEVREPVAGKWSELPSAVPVAVNTCPDVGDVFSEREANQMPQFQIEGEAEIFDAAEEIDVRGEIARHSFVTAEKSAGDDTTVIITAVDPKDLSEFEGLLFQIDINEEEDLVILRQVQMFFWPWEDDEEFEEMGTPDDEPGGA